MTTTAATWPSHGSRFWHDALWLAVGDMAVIILSLLAGDGASYAIYRSPVSVQYSLLLIPAWWVGAMMTRLYPGWGVAGVEELRRIESLLALIFGAAAAYLFLTGIGLGANRANFFISFVFCAFMLPAFRHAVRTTLLRRGRWGAPCVVYGRPETVQGIGCMLAQQGELGFMPVGCFCDSPPVSGGPQALPWLGTLADIAPTVGVAVLEVETMAPDRERGFVDGPLAAYRAVLLAPELPDAPSVWVRPLDARGSLLLEVRNNLLDPLAAASKRAMDLLLVLVFAPLMLPVMLAGLLAAWLQDFHSPFFAQERIGRDGRPFKALKIRTMRPTAEQELESMLEQNERLQREWTVSFKLKQDPRITRVGACLRRWSVDEFPQLWNVLKGEMSWVGPRPLPPYHHQRLRPGVRGLRERVRPGVTGLWQIYGRGDLEHGDLEKWDSYYVRNWSVWLDLLTLAQTLGVVLRGRGAY